MESSSFSEILAVLAQGDLAPRQAAGGINQLNQREANKPIIYITVRFARIGLLLGLECSNVVYLILRSSSKSYNSIIVRKS